MNELENEIDQDLDEKISLAMDKIIQDTIGQIPLAEDYQLTPTGQSPEAAVNEESGKKRRVLKTIMMVLLIIAVLAGIGTYGSFAYYYRDKFIPQTSINGIACYNLTVSETEQLIREKVENYSLNISFREDKNQDISGQDIDYAYVSDDSVSRIMQQQNWLGWIFGFIKESAYEVSENISFNEEKLQQSFSELDCLQEDAQITPADAFVNYQNGQFEIVPEVEGTTINNEILLAAVKTAISTSQTSLSTEAADAYLQPQVRSDSEQLAAEQSELNVLVNASVTYQLPSGPEVLDGNTLRTWLQVDEQGHFVKDNEIFKERLTEYVTALAAEVDTIATERPFTTTSGLDITVSGGSYGWKINQSEEIATLTQNLENYEQLKREPEYSSREVTTENNGFGNTYIEINLTDQELYYYQDGEIVVQSSFVSGRMTKSRYTPPGIFTLNYKSRDRVLRGAVQPDGSYEYESHVNFWMPFNGGIGLHDASWRGTFGGTIYKYRGSHGCINMPYEKAKAVYELITKDVPIICFYTDGYSFVY